MAPEGVGKIDAMAGRKQERDWRTEAGERARFMQDVLPTGLVPVLAIGSFVTVLVGGSLLDLFQVDPWFGIAVVVFAIYVASFEGAFSRWQAVVEVADAGGTLPLALADVLANLVSRGKALCVRVEEDATWGVIHHGSGFQGWVTASTDVLNAEVPELAIWLHQMNSPSRRSAALPGDPKQSALTQFRWSIDRLADIEDIVRARGDGGHPEGHEKTDRLLLLDRCLRLFQESDNLKRRLVAGMSMFPGYLEADEVDKLVADCSERLGAVLLEVFGSQRASELVESATVDAVWTMRDDINQEDAGLFMRRAQALRDALRCDALTIRP